MAKKTNVKIGHQKRRVWLTFLKRMGFSAGSSEPGCRFSIVTIARRREPKAEGCRFWTVTIARRREPKAEGCFCTNVSAGGEPKEILLRDVKPSCVLSVSWLPECKMLKYVLSMYLAMSFFFPKMRDDENNEKMRTITVQDIRPWQRAINTSLPIVKTTMKYTRERNKKIKQCLNSE